MRLVQIARDKERRVAVADGDTLRIVDPRWTDIYSLATHAVGAGTRLEAVVGAAVSKDTIEYDPVYQGQSEWRVLPAFDHPTDPAHCLVSGTGLTHKASAENRAAMHKEAAVAETDSSRMYRMGVEGGTPSVGQIGVQPEWFYKGDGSVLRAHGQELDVPPYAWDGGEEPEIAGAYVISQDGQPLRVGLMMGNEFSDHRMEKKNYLYLAPSKLRSCAIGPELLVGDDDFASVEGSVSVWRGGAGIWSSKIWSGQKNMCHSLANLEHHHFKYPAHRRPGDVHIHFFGADAFSFGAGIELAAGDVMEVAFPHFGRALRNPLRVEARPESLVKVNVV